MLGKDKTSKIQEHPSGRLWKQTAKLLRREVLTGCTTERRVPGLVNCLKVKQRGSGLQLSWLRTWVGGSFIEMRLLLNYYWPCKQSPNHTSLVTPIKTHWSTKLDLSTVMAASMSWVPCLCWIDMCVFCLHRKSLKNRTKQRKQQTNPTEVSRRLPDPPQTGALLIIQVCEIPPLPCTLTQLLITGGSYFIYFHSILVFLLSYMVSFIRLEMHLSHLFPFQRAHYNIWCKSALPPTSATVTLRFIHRSKWHTSRRILSSLCVNYCHHY